MRPTLVCTLALCAIVAAHVPSYESAKCIGRTVVDAKVSQVTYFEYANPGQIVGLTLDLMEHEDVWTELKSGLVVSISASRWNELQESGFFIGCLSTETTLQLCSGALSSFPEGGEKLKKSKGSHEPFTQSVHYPVEPANNSKVDRTNCTKDQVLALLVKPGMGGGRFSVVLGVSELFTLEQLVSFPIFMARNHGSFVNVNYIYWMICTWIAVVVTLHAVLSIIRNGCKHYATSLIGSDTPSFMKLAALTCLASICVYVSVIVDITLQATFASQQDNVTKTNIGLFVGLVLCLANIVPTFLAVYTWWRLLAVECDNGAVTITHMVVVSATHAICFVSLLLLGESPQVPLLLGTLVVITFIGMVTVAIQPVTRGQLCVYSLIMQISLFVLYLFFLGSGYLLGPGLMILSTSALLVHTICHTVAIRTNTPHTCKL